MRHLALVALLLVAFSCTRKSSPSTPTQACWGEICEPNAGNTPPIVFRTLPPKRDLPQWWMLAAYLRNFLMYDGALEDITELELDPHGVVPWPLGVPTHGLAHIVQGYHISFALRCKYLKKGSQEIYTVQNDRPREAADLLHQIRNKIRETCGGPVSILGAMLGEVAEDQIQECGGQPPLERAQVRLARDATGIGPAEDWDQLVQGLSENWLVISTGVQVLLDPYHEAVGWGETLFWADMAVRCDAHSDSAIARPAAVEGMDSVAFQAWMEESIVDVCLRPNRSSAAQNNLVP